MGILVEKPELHNRTGIFAGREDAGKQLGMELLDKFGPDALVLAIPSGGVPIGLAISGILGLDLDLLLVRKVQIPWNTEAGFAALNLDGDLLVNERLLAQLNLSREEIDTQVEKTMATLRQRNRVFRPDQAFPDLEGRQVLLVDDGLASGYTMQAAIAYVKKRNPQELTIAVPTASADTVRQLLPEVDRLYCLNVRDFYPFAVAAAYRSWHDLSDQDVLDLLAGS